MVTAVGMQSDFISAVKDLLELEYDAIEAYDEAVKRINNQEYKSKLTEFANDHRRHVKEISGFLNGLNEEVPTGPSMKKYLTKGKVILADLVGDEMILKAMKDNELDTNSAYSRMNDRTDKHAQAQDIISRGLQDEKKHKEWLENF